MKFWFERWDLDRQSDNSLVKSCKVLGEAHERCLSHILGLPNGSMCFVKPTGYEFLLGSDEYGYESFMFKEGDLVTSLDDKFSFGIVEGYGRAVKGWGVKVLLSNGESSVFTPSRIRISDIPKEVIGVVKAKLSEKCPLMGGGCDGE